MKGRARQRRLVFFAVLTLILVSGLSVAAYVSTRDQFRVVDWQSRLGAPERAALDSVLEPASENPADDPLIAIPGFQVDPGQLSRQMDREMTVFKARLAGPTAADDLYTAIEGYWQSKGLKTEREKVMLVGLTKDGDQYTVLWNNSHGAAALIWLWRVRKIPTSTIARPDYDWPKKFGELFPKIPRGPSTLETGRPGYPGYSAMITANGDPKVDFMALDKDLKKRGWEPFPLDRRLSSPGILDGDQGNAYSRAYRHTKAPFGCQLVVIRDTQQLDTCRIMLSLF